MSTNEEWLQLHSKSIIFKNIKQMFKNKNVLKNRGNIPEDLLLKLLTVMVLLKKCNIPTLVGIMYVHNAQTTANILLDAVKKGYIGLHCNTPTVYYDPENLSSNLLFEVKLIPPQLNMEEYEGYIHPLPNLEPGIPNNIMLGYSMEDPEDMIEDIISLYNNISCSLNEDVIANCKNSWKTDNEKAKKAFEVFTNVTEDSYKAMLMLKNQFYFDHNLDKRGRIYSKGYHINPQGNQYQKAVIQFTKKEKLV